MPMQVSDGEANLSTCNTFVLISRSPAREVKIQIYKGDPNINPTLYL